MANKALYRSKDGSFSEVDGSSGISWLRMEAAKGNLFCSGLHGTCGAQVEPFQTEHGIFFRIQHNQKHKYGCECDDTDAAKIVRNLDHVGRDVSPEDLFQKFSRPKHEEGSEGKERSKGTSKGADEKPDIDKDFEDDMLIRRESRDPRNLKELCALLSKKDPEDTYAGVRVSDMFIGHRNIAEIRRNGIPEGRPIIILLRPVSRNRLDSLNLKVPDQAIVLGDAYSYVDHDEQLICIIQGTWAARKKIFGINDKKKEERKEGNTTKKRKKIIAIFGIWTKDPSNEGVYICEPINDGQVFSVEENFYD